MSSTDVEEKVQPTDRSHRDPMIWHWYCMVCNGPQPFPVGSIARCGFKKTIPGRTPGWKPPADYQACVVCDDLSLKPCRRHPHEH